MEFKLKEKERMFNYRNKLKGRDVKEKKPTRYTTEEERRKSRERQRRYRLRKKMANSYSGTHELDACDYGIVDETSAVHLNEESAILGLPF